MQASTEGQIINQHLLLFGPPLRIPARRPVAGKDGALRWRPQPSPPESVHPSLQGGEPPLTGQNLADRYCLADGLWCTAPAPWGVGNPASPAPFGQGLAPTIHRKADRRPSGADRRLRVRPRGERSFRFHRAAGRQSGGHLAKVVGAPSTSEVAAPRRSVLGRVGCRLELGEGPSTPFGVTVEEGVPLPSRRLRDVHHQDDAVDTGPGCLPRRPFRLPRSRFRERRHPGGPRLLNQAYQGLLGSTARGPISLKGRERVGPGVGRAPPAGLRERTSIGSLPPARHGCGYVRITLLNLTGAPPAGL